MRLYPIPQNEWVKCKNHSRNTSYHNDNGLPRIILFRVDIHTVRKSINDERINYKSRGVENFFLDLMRWIDVLRVQSRKKNPVHLSRFRDGLKNDNFKKIRKYVVF